MTAREYFSTMAINGVNDKKEIVTIEHLSTSSTVVLHITDYEPTEGGDGDQYIVRKRHLSYEQLRELKKAIDNFVEINKWIL